MHKWDGTGVTTVLGYKTEGYKVWEAERDEVFPHYYKLPTELK